MKASQDWLDDLVDGVGFLCLPKEEVEETKMEIKGL